MTLVKTEHCDAGELNQQFVISNSENDKNCATKNSLKRRKRQTDGSKKTTKYKYWFMDADDRLSFGKMYGRFYYRHFMRYIDKRQSLNLKRKWAVWANDLDKTYIETFAEDRILPGDDHDPKPYLKHMCLYLPPIFGGEGFTITDEEADKVIADMNAKYKQHHDLFDQRDYNVSLMATAYRRPFNSYKKIKFYVVDNNSSLSMIDNDFFKKMVKYVISFFIPFLNIKVSFGGEVNANFEIPIDNENTRHIRIAYEKCSQGDFVSESPFFYSGPPDPKQKLLTGTRINICIESQFESSDLSLNSYNLWIILQHEFLHILGLNHNPNVYSIMSRHTGLPDEDDVIINPFTMSVCDYNGIVRIYGEPPKGKPPNVERYNNLKSMQDILTEFDSTLNIFRFNMKALPPMGPIEDVCSGKHLLYEYIDKWNDDDDDDDIDSDTENEPNEGDENPSLPEDQPIEKNTPDEYNGDENLPEDNPTTNAQNQRTISDNAYSQIGNSEKTANDENSPEKIGHGTPNRVNTGNSEKVLNETKQHATKDDTDLDETNSKPTKTDRTEEPGKTGKFVNVYMNRFYNNFSALFRVAPKIPNTNLKFFTLNSPLLFYIRNCDPERIEEEINICISLLPQNYRYCFMFTYCCEGDKVYDGLEGVGQTIVKNSKKVFKYSLTRVNGYIVFLIVPNDINISQNVNSKHGTIYGTVGNMVVSHITKIEKRTVKILKNDLNAGKDVLMPLVDPDKYLYHDALHVVQDIMDMMNSTPDLGISSILYSKNILVRPYPFNNLNAVTFLAPVEMT